MWLPRPKQELFLKSPAYETGFGGTKGPGKTDALIADGSAQLDKSNYKAILFRRTYKQLEEVETRTHKYFSKQAKWHGDRHFWQFPSGARFYLSHCQHEKDKENHQGQEYHWMGFDQLETFTLSMYQYLMMQVRTSDPSIRCFIRSTFNPGGIGHAWVKKRFIDACTHDGKPIFFLRQEDDKEVAVPAGTANALSRSFVFSTIFDNKHILENDPNYLANLNSLPENLRKAMRDGDWDAFEGQFFSEFERALHVISIDQYAEITSSMPHIKIISLDYGFSKPSSAHWHAIFPDGDMITYKELYGPGRDYPTLAKEILRMSQGEKISYLVADPAIQGDKSHHSEVKDGDAKGESGFDIMRKLCGNDFPTLMGDNRRIVGWNRMHEYLKPYINGFGDRTAKWRITRNCTQLIATLPALIHSSINPEDVDTDGEDHAADGCRYGIMSRQPLPDAPPVKQTKDQVFWERVKADIKSGENTDNSGQMLEGRDILNEDIENVLDDDN